MISPTSQYYTLNFTVGTEIANKTLTIFSNGKLIGYLPVYTTEPYTYLMSVFLKEGVNELSFSCDQSFIPANIADSLDTRRLSVFLQNVEILPEPLPNET